MIAVHWCARAHVCVCVRACTSVCVCVCVCVCVWGFKLVTMCGFVWVCVRAQHVLRVRVCNMSDQLCITHVGHPWKICWYRPYSSRHGGLLPNRASGWLVRFWRTCDWVVLLIWFHILLTICVWNQRGLTPFSQKLYIFTPCTPPFPHNIAIGKEECEKNK